MSLIRDLWDALTYRNEWTTMPPRFPARAEPNEYELVMFNVDRKTGRVRVAAARRAKEER